MPFLSIIIPTYNCETYLEESLDSVLKQLPEDYELIIVDDGSQEATRQILARYEGMQENLRIAYNPHKGASGARNRGLEMARGEYVAFMDCDDCMIDGFLLKSRPLLLERAGLYIFGIERVFLTGSSEFWTVSDRVYSTVSEFADEYIRSRNLLIYSGCNKFYRRDIIEEAKLRFDEDTTFGEDRLFNYRYLTLLNQRSPETAVITSSMVMFQYIQRTQQSMSSKYIPHYFRQVMRLHKNKIHCFLALSQGTTEQEKLDFEAYDLSREIEKTIDRFPVHPEEKEENLPEINQIVFARSQDLNDKVDALVILGSPNCFYKVETALDIGKLNTEALYIVSGGNLHKSGDCTEAEFMYSVLTAQGIDESKIYLENRARDTAQNLEFSAGIIQELIKDGRLPGGKQKPVIGIVTAAFHTPRSQKLLQRMDAWDEMEVRWFPAFGPTTQEDTWFNYPAARALILGDLQKTVRLH